MDSEQRQHLQELREIYQKRLRVLERQAASRGQDTPAYIQIEIEDIKGTITDIDEQLAGKKLLINRSPTYGTSSWLTLLPKMKGRFSWLLLLIFGLLLGIGLSAIGSRFFTLISPYTILTLTARECRISNLLSCSNPVPVFIPGESLSTVTLTSGKLAVEFDNKQKGSGVAFLFNPALDVRSFSYLELTGTSSEGFTFLVEYKVSNPLGIVKNSNGQLFPATSDRATVKVPIVYDGKIDEIIINFFETEKNSKLIIESIRLIY